MVDAVAGQSFQAADSWGIRVPSPYLRRPAMVRLDLHHIVKTWPSSACETTFQKASLPASPLWGAQNCIEKAGHGCDGA